MKVFERLVLDHLKQVMCDAEDKLQFAYKNGVGETPNSTIRVTFFVFSSAFDTIQPVLLRNKMVNVGLELSMVNWLIGYISNRPGLCVSG